MAKLKAPLMSLGASGKLGGALVYFDWKGLNVVREYVIPSNPKTSGQTTQRGHLAFAVASIHAAQAHAVDPLNAGDISAWALYAGVTKSATTWFNRLVKQIVDQLVAGLIGSIYTQGTTTPGADELAVEVQQLTGETTAGNFHYGTSKTAMINTEAAAVAANNFSATLSGLVTGVKYFWQFRATADADAVGNRSGIYYGVPT